MILVTGANGQLGQSLRKLLENDDVLKHEVVYTDVTGDCEHLDITDITSVREIAKTKNVNIIVNCAAYTNVDKAEDEPELAELLNAKAVENLAIAMDEVNGFLVHISTDYVLGGNQNNTPCTENQKENPTGMYGLTKLHGEQAIKHVGCKHVILRTAWLYSEYGKNFVKTMMSLTATKPMLNVVFDQTGTPTYATDLAKAIICVINDYGVEDQQGKTGYSKTGTYHFSNEGVCSWFDFTKTIAEMSGNCDCDILPCHSNEFPSKVIRPSYSVLDKTKIKATFNITIPYWTDSLRICINNLLSQNS